MKRLFIFVFILLIVCFLVSCKNENIIDAEPNNKQYEIYKLAQKSGYEGTYEEWFNSIKGKDGEPGRDGVGITSIAKTGSNDNIDIYTIYLSNGTTTTFSISNGKDGAPGKEGAPGKDGTPGKDGIGIESIVKIKSENFIDTYEIKLTNGLSSYFEISNGVNGKDGHQGLSAYEIYLKYNPDYDKTEEEWINDYVNNKLSEKLDVTFIVQNYSDGSKKTVNSLELFKGDLVNQPEELTKIGYEFDGWYLYKNDTILDKWNFNIYPITTDLELIAICYPITYNITYDYKSGTPNGNTQMNFTYGEEIKLPDVSKKGYKFLGFKDQYGKLYKDVITCNFANDLQLVAQYELINYSITYVLNGGSFTEIEVPMSYNIESDFILPVPTLDKKVFAGWYDNEYFEGKSYSNISDYSIYKIGNLKLYAAFRNQTSKWELNKMNFNGNGCDFGIMCYPLTETDPFNNNYINEDKISRQAHQNFVEAAYNIKIKYYQWSDEAYWGPARVQYIVNEAIDEGFKNRNVYALTGVTSSWIPTIQKNLVLASLYNVETQSGIFEKIGKPIDEIENYLGFYKDNVYGMLTDYLRPDQFMFYNATLASQIGMEDPAEMWFKGTWKWSNFIEWVNAAQIRLGYEQYALDCGYYEFSTAATASTGKKMVNAKTGYIMFTKSSVVNIFDQMRTFYNYGIQNLKHGVSDVTMEFLNGDTILTSGGLGFINNETRFDPNRINFEIGVVPYPMDDDSEAIPYTSPYAYEDSDGNMINVKEPIVTRGGVVLEDSLGNPIYGLDLSNSTYNISILDSQKEYLYILNSNYTASNISTQMATSVCYDLFNGYNKEGNLSSDEYYKLSLKAKFDSDIYVNVVMSVQDKSLQYYDPINMLSMTVGNGSHFGPNGFYIVANECATRTGVSPAVKLAEVIDFYNQAMDQIGY